MRRRTYVWELLKEAVTGTWDGYDIIGAIPTAVAWLGAWLFPAEAKEIELATANIGWWWWVLGIGLFVAFRIWRAAYRLYDRAHTELTTFKETRERKLRIGEFMRQCSNLETEVISSEDQFFGWDKRRTEWYDDVTAFLLEHWPEKVAFFQDTNSIAYDTDGFNAVHRRLKIRLGKLRENLKELLRD